MNQEEIDNLTDRELDRSLADIDTVQANYEPGTMREIQLRCGRCLDPARCHRLLRGDGANDDYHAFCPSAKTLDDLPHHAKATALGLAIAETND